MKIQLELEEEERQMVLMALAQLAVRRPGWDYALNHIALRIDNRVGLPDRATAEVPEGHESRAEMFDKFKDMHQNELRVNQFTDHLERAAGS